MIVSVYGGVGMVLITLPPALWLTFLLATLIVEMVSTARGVSDLPLSEQVKSDSMVAVTLLCVVLTSVGFMISLGVIVSDNLVIEK